MEIDIGENIVEQISFHNGDDPEEIALILMEKHNLDLSVGKIIEKHIR